MAHVEWRQGEGQRLIRRAWGGGGPGRSNPARQRPLRKQEMWCSSMHKPHANFSLNMTPVVGLRRAA